MTQMQSLVRYPRWIKGSDMVYKTVMYLERMPARLGPKNWPFSLALLETNKLYHSGPVFPLL